jgi:CHAD domain-containing protein
MRLLLRNLKIVAADAEHEPHRVCDEQIQARFADRCRSVVQALGTEADVRSLHALRIAVKKLRYAATPLLPVLRDQNVPELIESLEGLQTQLGVMHDHVVARQELERSFTTLKKPSHQKIIQDLIQIESRRIIDSVATFRDWLKSDACRELRYRIESIVIANMDDDDDGEDTVSGSTARGLL